MSPRSVNLPLNRHVFKETCYQQNIFYRCFDLVVVKHTSAPGLGWLRKLALSSCYLKIHSSVLQHNLLGKITRKEIGSVSHGRPHLGKT